MSQQERHEHEAEDTRESLSRDKAKLDNFNMNIEKESLPQDIRATSSKTNDGGNEVAQARVSGNADHYHDDDGNDKDQLFVTNALMSGTSTLCNLISDQKELLFKHSRKTQIAKGQVLYLEGTSDQRYSPLHRDVQHPSNHFTLIQRHNSTDGGLADADELLEFAEDYVEEYEQEQMDEHIDDSPYTLPETKSSKGQGRLVSVRGNNDDDLTIDVTEHGKPTDSGSTNPNDQETTQALPSSEDEQVVTEEYFSPPISPGSGRSSSLYIIQSGTVGVFYDQRRVATLGPGSVLGEDAFLWGRPHSASIIADCDLECVVIHHEDFVRNVLQQNEYLETKYKKYSHNNTNFITKLQLERWLRDMIVTPPTTDSVEVSKQLPLLTSALIHLFQTSPSKSGIAFHEFCLLHLLLAQPDPEVEVAFAMLDRNGKGAINFRDIEHFLPQGEGVMPSRLNSSDFIRRHFGENKERKIRKSDFAPFLKDFSSEMGKLAFWQIVQTKAENAKDHRGLFVSEILPVLGTYSEYRIPSILMQYLETYVKTKNSCAHDAGNPDELEQPSFSYTDFLKMQDTLRHLPDWQNFIHVFMEGATTEKPIFPNDLLRAHRYQGGRMDRYNAEMLVELLGLNARDINLVQDAFSPKIIPQFSFEDALMKEPANHKRNEGKPAADTKTGKDEDHLLTQVFNLSSRFVAAVCSGGLGVLSLYPLDLVKTRMMNQRIGSDGSRLYLQSLDCFQKVMRYEGLPGLYRGLLPPLLAAGPELAIMFGVRDLLRSLPASSDQSNWTHWLMESGTGACAGACQLLVTNPLEITKIRMQSQGETSRLFKAYGVPNLTRIKTFSEVAVEMQLSGLYRGAAACLLRDIPFGAMYFPMYTFSKDYLMNNESMQGVSPTAKMWMAGTLAGIPASFLTTPSDVVKTRLQTIPRPGEAIYGGLRDCVQTIYKSEGGTAFFKGSAARVCRISTQVGIAVTVYETLTQYFVIRQQDEYSSPQQHQNMLAIDQHKSHFNLVMQSKLNDINHVAKVMNFQEKRR